MGLTHKAATLSYKASLHDLLKIARQAEKKIISEAFQKRSFVHKSQCDGQFYALSVQNQPERQPFAKKQAYRAILSKSCGIPYQSDSLSQRVFPRFSGRWWIYDKLCWFVCGAPTSAAVQSVVTSQCLDYTDGTCSVLFRPGDLTITNPPAPAPAQSHVAAGQ